MRLSSVFIPDIKPLLRLLAPLTTFVCSNMTISKTLRHLLEHRRRSIKAARTIVPRLSSVAMCLCFSSHSSHFRKCASWASWSEARRYRIWMIGSSLEHANHALRNDGTARSLASSTECRDRHGKTWLCTEQSIRQVPNAFAHLRCFSTTTPVTSKYNFARSGSHTRQKTTLQTGSKFVDAFLGGPWTA